MISDIASQCISPTDSLRQALACINRNAKGIVLVVDSDQRLIGTVTDGDIRRAILNGDNLDISAAELLDRKVGSPVGWPSGKPVTAPAETRRMDLLHLMQEHVVYQIPLLDPDGRVVSVVTLEELLPDQVIPLQAVIMAGGFSTRLRPLTEDLPKPMLQVGDRPIMEMIVEQLCKAGIRRVNVTTHYKSKKIIDHFGDGHDFGVEFNYVREDRPLGTAGALGLMQTPKEPLLVINGDILTQVDFRSMLAFHTEHKADLTVAVRRYDLNVPYGVIESENAFVQELVEKPVLSFFVNAGIYLLEPSVHSYVPDNQHYDMTNLIQALLDADRPVVSFPIHEYWLDIGQHVDYERAVMDVQSGRFKP